MAAVPHVPLREVVDVLRSVPSGIGHVPTVAQVQILVEDIWAMRDVRLSQAREELSAFTTDELIQIAELFGRHRAQVKRGKLQGRRKRFEVEASGMLLPPTEDEVRRAGELLAAGHTLRGCTAGHKQRVCKDLRAVRHAIELAQETHRVLPGGYDPYSCGRNVAVSLDAILAEPVTEAEIIRFVDRTYTLPSLQVTADHVLLLHWLARHHLAYKLLDAAGKTAELDGERTVITDTGTPNPALAKVMTDAFDLLDVARKDALRGLAAVVRREATTPDQVRGALGPARWISPTEIGRLLVLCDRALAQPDNAALGRVFTAQVDSFVRLVRTAPDRFVLREVEQLTLSHVLQVLTAAGLPVEDGEEKAAARELRGQLVAMGLTHDLDRELPEAVRAWRAGRLEEYFASRQARLDGDPDWARLYVTEEAPAS